MDIALRSGGQIIAPLHGAPPASAAWSDKTPAADAFSPAAAP